jgi:hypothetical protein
MKRRAFLVQLAAAFGVLTVVAVVLTWQRANAAGEALGDATELTAPAQQKVVLDEPGRYEVVLLAQVPADGEETKPRLEEVRHLSARLASPGAGDVPFESAPGLGSQGEKDAPMLLTLGAFEVTDAGPYLLSLAYEGRSGPRAKLLFGKDAHSKAEDAARWAFSILLALFLGGCLTLGALLMGIVFGVKVPD